MAKQTENESSHLFQELSLEKPADLIIQQIRKQIRSGQLKPGDRLPPERKLVEHFGVGRGHIREALRKLEFYGILRTVPQSGTFVAGMGINALEGLISDVLAIEGHEFVSLVETRLLLETHAARLAAERRSEEDIVALQEALDAYEEKVNQGISAVEEDFMFHLKIAEASKNSVLKSLMLIVIPDIIKNFLQLDICTSERASKPLEEHRIILKHIIAQEPDLATTAMQSHLQDVITYGEQLKGKS
jgi:GntR family transcriptional repressor for pyruvate dehydrogenase complex